MAKQGKKRRKRTGGKISALRGRTIELDIRDMAAGGRGLGMIRGKPVFVPYTIPGESITAEITGERRGALIGRGLRLQAASADRVSPRCQHFGPGRCWGCQWQHIDYAAQLLLKQDVLADQLSRQGKLPDELIAAALRPLAPARQEWAYNHSLRLGRESGGNWGLRRENGAIEAISECQLAHPDLLAALADLDLDYATARALTLRRGSDGRIMLIFEVDAEEAPGIRTDLPLSVNLILPDREPINLIGDAQSRFEVAGQTIRVTAGAYMRPNLGGVEALIAEVEAALDLDGDQRVLDLYAGVGIFSAFMASRASLISLVESYPPAANDAEANLSAWDNVDIIEGAVEAVLSDMDQRGADYDIALLDPPSAGLSGNIVDSLAKLTVRRVVYVSGDPASLARDSRALIRAGFRLQAIQALDLSPQTWYISAVARFER